MEELLEQSDCMDDAFRACLARAPFEPSLRAIVAGSMCAIALEHGGALRQLLGSGRPSSALALFRCQFEIVVRATWTTFAASDEWLERFTAPVETLDEPVRPKSMDDMLADIVRSAPRKASQLLNELKAAAWKPLHSYVHGGVRPVAESIGGYNDEFLRKTVLNSNGLNAMAALVNASLSSDAAKSAEVVSITYGFLHCLPPRS